MVNARWRGLLNWWHWGTITIKMMAHKNRIHKYMLRALVTWKIEWEKAANTPLLSETCCLGCQKKRQCTMKWIHPSLRQRKDQRLALRMQGERGRKRRIWTMVSNPRTLVQWWMLLFNKQSFWVGKRGGASCWQCQGPYQLVSASATETNDWATAFLCVHDRQKHRGPHHIYGYIHEYYISMCTWSALLPVSYWQFTDDIMTCKCRYLKKGK